MSFLFVQSRLCICILLLLVSCTSASPVTHKLNVRWTRPWQNETGSAIFLEQMENPSEVFSVMLIIGGDIIQKAVAQLSGRKITYIAFSFGWVAYAFNTLMSAFGDGSLMPDPDFGAEVITVSSRIKKSNDSWLICRLIRDLERDVSKRFGKLWFEVDPFSDPGVEGLLNTNDPNLKCREVSQINSGLLVTFCTALEGAGHPRLDMDFYLFLGVVVVQLTIAMIPTILYGNWSVIFMTAAGTALAVLTASLREWRLEKYQARTHSKQTYAITRGNGHSHVFIIEPGVEGPNKKYPGLFLDDLAGAVRKADNSTRIKSILLAIVWIWFLITAGGLKDHTWYLLLVGIIGMAENVWVAGHHRDSGAHGIPLRVGDTYGLKSKSKEQKSLTRHGKPVHEWERGPKVMDVLMEVEVLHPGVGLALRPEFFPNALLRDNEKAWWDGAEAYRKDKKKPKPIYPPPKPVKPTPPTSVPAAPSTTTAVSQTVPPAPIPSSQTTAGANPGVPPATNPLSPGQP